MASCAQDARDACLREWIMRKILIALFFGFAGCSANAQSIEPFDCVAADKPDNVFSYIFDKSNSSVQYISGSANDPRFNPQHGQVFPATMSGTALIVHLKKQNEEPSFDMAISRADGEAHYDVSGPMGTRHFDVKCRPSSRYTAFVKPVLSFDASGDLALACQRLQVPSMSNPAPVQYAPFNLKTMFRKSTMQLTEPDRSNPLQSAVVGRILSINPNRVRVCYTSSCDTTFAVLNLVTGVLEAFSMNLMPTGSFSQCKQDEGGGRSKD
jgi:hypothetical protein